MANSHIGFKCRNESRIQIDSDECDVEFANAHRSTWSTDLCPSYSPKVHQSKCKSLPEHMGEYFDDTSSSKSSVNNIILPNTGHRYDLLELLNSCITRKEDYDSELISLRKFRTGKARDLKLGQTWSSISDAINEAIAKLHDLKKMIEYDLHQLQTESLKDLYESRRNHLADAIENIRRALKEGPDKWSNNSRFEIQSMLHQPFPVVTPFDFQPSKRTFRIDCWLRDTLLPQLKKQLEIYSNDDISQKLPNVNSSSQDQNSINSFGRHCVPQILPSVPMSSSMHNSSWKHENRLVTAPKIGGNHFPYTNYENSFGGKSNTCTLSFQLPRNIFGKRHELPKDLRPVEVCYVEDPLHFYIRPKESNYFRSIEKLLLNADSWIGVSEHKLEKEIQKNECKLYAAKCDDNRWYRVAIKRVTGARIYVRKIDVGSTEPVSVRSIKEIPRDGSFSMYSRDAASHCALYNFHPSASGTWTPSVLNKAFKDLVTEKEVFMDIIHETKDIKEVNLYLKSGSEFLLCSDLLVPADDNERELVIPDPRTKEIVQQMIFKPKLFRYTYYDEELKKGGHADVHVTHIDSPANFYVVRANEPKCLTIYNDMQTKLTVFFKDTTNYSLYEPPKNLVAESAVALHAEDKVWKRGVILKKLKSTKYETRFVDTGVRTKLNRCKIRILPEDFGILTVRSINCCLHSITKPKSTASWSSEAVAIFNEMVQDKEVRLIVEGETSPCNRYYVTLHLNIDSPNSVCVNEELVRKGYAYSKKYTLPELERLKVEMEVAEGDEQLLEYIGPKTYADDTNSKTGSTIEPPITENRVQQWEHQVEVLSYTSPKEIYVQFCIHETEINDLLVRMMNFYSNNENNESTQISAISIDMKCAIWLQEEKKWTRAVVSKEINNEEVEVLLTDLGKKSVVNVNDIRDLPREFMNQIDGATLCKLAGCENECLWPDDIEKRMEKQMTKYNTYYISSLKVEEGISEVELWGKKRDFSDPFDACTEINVKINEVLLEHQNEPKSSGVKENTSMSLRNYDTKIRSETSKNTLKVEDWMSKQSFHFTELDGFENMTGAARNDFENVTNHIFEDDSVSVCDKTNEQPWLPPKKLSGTRFIIYPQAMCDEEKIISFHLKKDSMQLENMILDLNDKVSKNVLSPCSWNWQVGHSCIAYFDECPGYYRAKVLKVEEDERIQVHYVDYGNDAIVEPMFVRRASCYHELPILLHKLHLRSDFVMVNPKTKERFVEWTSVFFGNNNSHELVLRKEKNENFYRIYELTNKRTSREFFEEAEKMKFLMRRSIEDVLRFNDNRYGVNSASEEDDSECVDTGSSIASEEQLSSTDISLLKLQIMKEQNMNKITLNQITQIDKVHVSEMFVPEVDELLIVNVTNVCCNNIIAINIVDDNILPVKFAKNRKNYLTMREDIRENAFTQPLLKSPCPGQLCCAQYYEDGEWYRAIVVKHVPSDTTKVTIYFIDYGNTEVVFPSALHQMKEEWVHVPAQAIKCIFELPYVESSGNSKVDILKSMLLDRKLEAKITPSLTDKQLKYTIKFPVYEKKLIEAILK